MAKGDIQIIKSPGEVRKYLAEDRTTSSQAATMKPGEPVKVGGTGTNFVYLLATGDPEIATDEFVGIVKEESTETSTADGTVLVYTIIPGQTILRGKATTGSNLADGIMGDWVCIDFDDTNFTFDENEGTDPNVHAFKIVAYDAVKDTVDVLVHANASEAAPLTGQTMD